VEACQRELNAHSYDDQSHKPRHHIVQQAAPATCTRPAIGYKHHNGPHYGHSHRNCDECRSRQRQLRMRNSECDDTGNRARARRKQDQRRERTFLYNAILRENYRAT
jgi:hypothetical protein